MQCGKEEQLQALAVRLFEVGGIKFGSFTLKSGVISPVYFDLRVIVSYPELLAEVSEMLWCAVKHDRESFQAICGVPYTALPMATLMSIQQGIPMLLRRKEAKDYGTKRMIEGKIVAGCKCLIVEDVITTGSSVMETHHVLGEVGVEASHAVVLLDREQGGRGNIEKRGVTIVSVMTLSQLITFLLKANKITMETVSMVKTFIANNNCIAIPDHIPQTSNMSYKSRSEVCSHPLGVKLLSLMQEKETNLALSADVTTSHQLIQLADSVGPYICMLKTHADIVSDFSLETSKQLKSLARKHNFIIMEDRKFGDIGNTVRLQYQQERYHLASGWAELVTCHALPGPGLIEGLKVVAPEGSGCVLVAEMSSKGSLTTTEYIQSSLAMAINHSDFVVGVVCRGHLSSAPPGLIHMTPGVRLDAKEDDLGQQYLSPKVAIKEKRSDIIIVGRGIIKAADPVAMAKAYREAAYSAYQERTNSL